MSKPGALGRFVAGALIPLVLLGLFASIVALGMAYGGTKPFLIWLAIYLLLLHVLNVWK